MQLIGNFAAFYYLACVIAEVFFLSTGMRKQLLLILLLAICFISSCNVLNRQKNQKVYTQILATNDSLEKKTKEWHQLLNAAIIAKDFTKLRTSRMNIGLYLARHRELVANLQYTEASTPILEREQIFLTTQANLVSELYPPFEYFNAMTPPETMQEQIKLISDDMINVTAVCTSIKRELQAFAKKNDVKTLK